MKICINVILSKLDSVTNTASKIPWWFLVVFLPYNMTYKVLHSLSISQLHLLQSIAQSQQRASTSLKCYVLSHFINYLLFLHKFHITPPTGTHTSPSPFSATFPTILPAPFTYLISAYFPGALGEPLIIPPSTLQHSSTFKHMNRESLPQMLSCVFFALHIYTSKILMVFILVCFFYKMLSHLRISFIFLCVPKAITISGPQWVLWACLLKE